MRAFLITLILLVNSSAVYAGGYIVGDGGHVVICQKTLMGHRSNTYELLDLYEYRLATNNQPQKRHIHPPLANIFTDYMYKQLDFYLGRAAKALGSGHAFAGVFRQAQLIYDELAFFSEAEFMTHTNRVDDGVSVSANCRVHIAAVHYFDTNKQKIQIAIKQEIYDYLDDHHKTMLLLHEAMHSWFGENKSSLAARQAVGYLSGSKQYRSRNKQAFKQLIETKRPQYFY